MAPPWLDVLDDTIRVCSVHNRPDLAEQLRRKRTRLLDPKLRVLVVGAPRQGKSQLVNALVNAPVCAVGDDVSTILPTVVQYADPPSAALVRKPLTASGETGGAGSAADRVPVPVEQVVAQVGGRAGALPRAELVRAEIGIPRTLLASGLVLIDTPGIGDLAGSRAASAFAALAQADAALLVLDSAHELGDGELELLRRVVRACPVVTVVLTKTDIAPDWRELAERARARLAGAGLPVRLVAVSAVLRQRAAQAGDKTLNAESGFAELIAHLQRDVVGQAETLARRAVGLAATGAVEQLAAPLQAELSAPLPALPAGELPELQVAQRRLNALRRRSVRWQNVLADEIADLVADVEYDLRDRTRKILRRVDEIFDQADPEQAWDPFADWLLENLSEAAERNFAWLIERSGWIARRIAANFPPELAGGLDGPDGGEEPGSGLYPASTFEVPRELFDSVIKPERPSFDRFTVTQKVHAGLRGSYGGVLMAGLITSMAGLPVINVISIGVGTLFGGKSLRDEGDARLKRRQAAAKAAAGRHVDDFFLKFGKDCKDIARRVQRRLRDHFTEVTEELQEIIMESARSAKRAVDSDVAQRDSRRQEVRRELAELTALQGRAQALASPRSALPQAGLKVVA